METITEKANNLAKVENNDPKYFEVMDINGNPAKISLEKLKEVIFGGMSLDMMCDGVFIATSDQDATFLFSPEEWSNKKNTNNYSVEGVAVVSNEHIIIVAPNQASTSLPWATQDILCGEGKIMNIELALKDWNGKENTKVIVNKSGVGSAADFCLKYSRGARKAGNWFLPSLAQAMMIIKNYYKINFCLSFIEGAEPIIAGEGYWTSSEHVYGSWDVDFSGGGYGGSFYYYNRTYTKNVRPVAEYKIIV